MLLIDDFQLKQWYRFLLLFFNLFFWNCGYAHYEMYIEDLFQSKSKSTENQLILTSIFQNGLSLTTNQELLEFSKTKLSVVEGYQGDEYQLKLKTAPTENVSIDISCDSSLMINGNLGGIRLEYDPNTWNSPQTLTVTATANQYQEGISKAKIQHYLLSNDPNFNQTKPIELDVMILDSNDVGVLFSKTNLSVAESGNADSFEIQLSTQPFDTVTLNFNSASEIQILGQSSFVFTPENWNVSQTFSVSAFDDSLSEGAHSAVIIPSLLSNDSRYQSINLNEIQVRIVDNDAPDVTLVSVDRSILQTFRLNGGSNHWVGLSNQTIPFSLDFSITGSCNVSCNVPFLIGIYGSTKLNQTPDSRVCQTFNDAAPHPKNLSFNGILAAPIEPGIYMVTIWRSAGGQCNPWAGGLGMVNNYSTQGRFLGVIEVLP
ncbi:hypothetical protein [Leptospira yanagawae]|uniref:hypothetical protein n=1 Tax=Leptospira yanagawae TaxID=293069 RepID=UPI000586EF86|nr:hypothetical protein [Leptospira yanagawae]